MSVRVCEYNLDSKKQFYFLTEGALDSSCQNFPFESIKLIRAYFKGNFEIELNYPKTKVVCSCLNRFQHNSTENFKASFFKKEELIRLTIDSHIFVDIILTNKVVKGDIIITDY